MIEAPEKMIVVQILWSERDDAGPKWRSLFSAAEDIADDPASSRASALLQLGSGE
jgi:hypothetical protein